MDCIFCKIMNNEIPSYTIYEDDLVKVFLDINPSTNGDTLIVPKKHIVTVFDLDDNLVTHIHKITKDLYTLYKEKLHVDGLTLVQNNDHGQEIKHYHLHLTPRYINDNLLHSFNKELLIDLEKTFAQITKN